MTVNFCSGALDSAVNRAQREHYTCLTPCFENAAACRNRGNEHNYRAKKVAYPNYVRQQPNVGVHSEGA